MFSAQLHILEKKIIIKAGGGMPGGGMPGGSMPGGVCPGRH